MNELQPDVESIIKKHALVNAIKHKGKAEIGAVVSKTIGERPDLKPTIDHLISWIRRIVDEINCLSTDKQYSILSETFPEKLSELQHPKIEAKRLPPLPNADQGKVVVRLPPEPSGFMHIGHAMAAVINRTYASMYDGKVWLRFEDTNPRKVKPLYFQSFIDGYTWLGVKWDYEKKVSDDMPILYAEGERLIKSGHAYGCLCKLEEIQTNRFTGTPCICRERNVDTNMNIWNGMLDGHYEEGAAVIRLKGDMNSQDSSLRDPSLFRIIDYPHPIQGRKYRMWPVYDFAVVVEDHLCKVTHIMRSMEFHISLQNWLRSLLDFREITVIQFSRFNFVGTPVSKRLLRPLLDMGLISGWDDPRMPTIEGLRRRGIISEAIRTFTLTVGYTRTAHQFEWDLINAVNRRCLDPISKRYFFVPNPILLEVNNAPRLKATLRFHPEIDYGVRAVETSGVFYVPRNDLDMLIKNSVFRLMELYNVKIEDISGSMLKGSYAGSEIREGIPKVQWVTEDHTKFTVFVPGPIFIDNQYNKNSLEKVDGLAEESCTNLKIGEIIQFSRFGFCRIDAPNVAILAHK